MFYPAVDGILNFIALKSWMVPESIASYSRNGISVEGAEGASLIPDKPNINPSGMNSI